MAQKPNGRDSPPRPSRSSRIIIALACLLALPALWVLAFLVLWGGFSLSVTRVINTGLKPGYRDSIESWGANLSRVGGTGIVVREVLAQAGGPHSLTVGSACIAALKEADATDGLLRVCCAREGVRLASRAAEGLYGKIGPPEVDEILGSFSGQRDLWPSPGRFSSFAHEPKRFIPLARLVIMHGSEEQVKRFARMVAENPVEKDIIPFISDGPGGPYPPERFQRVFGALDTQRGR